MESKKQTITIRRSALVIAMFAALLGGYGIHAYRSDFILSEAHAVPAEAAKGAPAANKAALPDFTDIVASQGPAVVNISVSGSVKPGLAQIPGLPQMDPEDPFYEFFRRFQMPAPQGSIPTHGLGSGFIVSPDGVVLTNAHVVANADEVIVKLTDKREFKAKVVGMDKVSDVAVLKIDAKGLPTVKIGDPERSRVGEWVIAIGSPFGFENSVTAGIISAKSRSLPDEGYVPFLQTDVAVNPGNSGGPLFNMNGEVIGINSQIYTRSGGYQGLSFSIPINVAMGVERQLMEHGKVSHGRLGVMIQEVSQQLAESFGLDKPEGALVSSVEKGSPAEKAGVEAGDVILKFNGKDIERSSDLPPLVSALPPGSRAELQIWHNGKAKVLSLNVGEMRLADSKGVQGGGQAGGSLGLTVRSLTRDESRQADVAGGVLVEGVDAGPAARAGIRAGDVILSVNGEVVSSVERLRALVAKKGKRIALLVLRNGQKMFVPISLG